MSTIVVGIYANISRAQRAVSTLIEAGYPWQSVSVVLQSALLVADDDVPMLQGYYPEPMLALDDESGRIVLSAEGFLAAGPLAESLHRGRTDPCYDQGTPALSRAFFAAGIDPPAARYLEEALDDGAILVAVECDDRRACDARSMLRGEKFSRLH